MTQIVVENSMQLIKITDLTERNFWVDKVWDLLCAAYKDVAGGLHFESPYAMLNETKSWEILHENGQVLATLLYKQKHGNKTSQQTV